MKLSLITAAICLGLVGAAGAAEPNTNQPAPPTILFLGDSITAAGGYVRIIGAELARQNPAAPPRVINKGAAAKPSRTSARPIIRVGGPACSPGWTRKWRRSNPPGW